MLAKWYFIFMISLIVSFAAAIAYSDHTRSECRVAAVENNIAVSDINKVCD